MLLPKPKLIIYDMNETLVSSESVYLHTFNMLLSRYKMKNVNKPYMDFIHDMSCEDVIIAWFGEKNEKQIHNEYEIYYKICSYNHLSIINNSLAFIKKSYTYNIKQVVITNKPDFVAKPELQRLGFLNYVDAVMFGNSKYSKTNTKQFDEILKTINLFNEKMTICNNKNLWVFGNSHQELTIAQKHNATLFLCNKDDIQNSNNCYSHIFYTQNFNEIDFD